MNIFGKNKPLEKVSPGIPVKQNRILNDLKLKSNATDLPVPVARQVQLELERLEKIDPVLADFSIGLRYVETILSLPWFQESQDNLDLNRAASILDHRHYGLKSVKERVLEYLAVKTLRKRQKGRILVVDDEDVARANLLHFFRKLGYVVDEATQGLEALEMVENGPFFDLIITDLKMDQMDGLTLVDTVAKTSPETSSIMLTGYATVSSAVDALRKGATHYLAKPINLDELKQVVEDILGKKKNLRVSNTPILCFSGPPGTGKTSIGAAVAASLGRKFVRISMAGLRDEAEIRGHRRSYAGALPGRIINEIKRAGVKNPCILLDEVDKLGQDFRGDPASVLLEILDPEQNTAFIDYYLEIPFDLSAAMFVATANDLDRLPGPLLDRLEVIEFSGYTLQEKRVIAQKYLLPQQYDDNGLYGSMPKIPEQSIDGIIVGYTRESGVRGLNRQLGNICRKLALQKVKGDEATALPSQIDETLLVDLLGPSKYRQEVSEGEDRAGVVTSLSWTNFGGEIMFIEALKMRGHKNLILTGSLGDILRESAQTALSYIRSNSKQYGIRDDFYDHADIHIHLPAGAVSKDGPSAGLAITLALLSLLTAKPAKREVAISGEMTLTGKILAVGGLREKLLAASRAGCPKVILPQKNKEDVEALPKDVTGSLNIILVHHVQDAIPHLL